LWILISLRESLRESYFGTLSFAGSYPVQIRFRYTKTPHLHPPNPHKFKPLLAVRALSHNFWPPKSLRVNLNPNHQMENGIIREQTPTPGGKDIQRGEFEGNECTYISHVVPISTSFWVSSALFPRFLSLFPYFLARAISPSVMLISLIIF